MTSENPNAKLPSEAALEMREVTDEELDGIAGGLAGNEPQVQMGTCPHCGQPIATSIGIVSGDCPYCGKPVPAEPVSDAGTLDPLKNAKIF